MSVLQDTFTKALDTTPSDQQESLREAMTGLRDSWDRLNRDLKSITSQLKSSIARWNELDDMYNRFNMWLSGAEAKLNEPAPVFAELGKTKSTTYVCVHTYLHIMLSMKTGHDILFSKWVTLLFTNVLYFYSFWLYFLKEC